MESEHSNAYLFKTAQFFGHPSVFPPPNESKLQAAIQFVIPELHVGNDQKESLKKLALKCGTEIWDMATQTVQTQETQKKATLFTIAFYLSTFSEAEKQKDITYTGRLIAERFLGLLSFFVGMKLSMVYPQITFFENGINRQIIPVAGRSNTPPIPIEFRTALLEKTDIPADIFSALFWLRRGLAERDSIETFSALMVCLQIMARSIVKLSNIAHCCQACGAQYDNQPPSITIRMRELIVSELGATPQLFKRLWKARNAITAHGDSPVTPEVLLDLTELKFDAAVLAYKSIKLRLNIPLNDDLSPNQAFFITDALMYSD
jgi:hypothetical protein